MRKLLLLWLFSPASIVLAQGEFIVKDSVYRSGEVKLISRDRIQFTKPGTKETAVYFIDDLTEYKIDRYSYERLIINGKSNFYKKYVSGKASLYRINGSYGIKVGGNLTLLNKNNFRTTLNDILFCRASPNVLSQLTFNSSVLTHVVQKSNNVDCELKNMPYRKFGLFTGYTNLDIVAEAKQMSIKPVGNGMGIYIAAFAEFPFSYNLTWIYLYTEAGWSSHNATLQYSGFTSQDFFAINTSAFSLMGGLKFVTKSGRARPYLKGMPVIGFARNDSPTGLVGARQDQVNDAFVPYRKQLKTESSKQLGYSISLGIQALLKNRGNIFLEGRISQWSTDHWEMEMKSSNVTILAGISL